MNPVERSQLATKQLQDRIKLKNRFPKYERVIDPDGSVEIKIVDAQNEIDELDEQEVINVDKIRSQIANKLSQIADPENVELMLDELNLSDHDMRFLNSIWQQVLTGIKKTFDNGASRTLVLDYIRERIYDTQLKSTKVASDRGTGEINDIISQTHHVIQLEDDWDTKYTNAVEEIKRVVESNGRVKFNVVMDADGYAEVRYPTGQKKIATNTQKRLDALEVPVKKAQDDLHALIEKSGKTGPMLLQLINDEEVKDHLKNNVLPNVGTSGSGYRHTRSNYEANASRPILPRSQKKSLR